MRRTLRYPDSEELIVDAAHQLVDRIAAIQAEGRIPQLGLSGDPLASEVLTTAVSLLAASAVNTQAIGWWWTDDAFEVTSSPHRHSLRALALMAATLALDPAQVHPLPSCSAAPDPETAAHAYAEELGNTSLDVCLLELGSLGQVAALFPGQRLGVAGEPCVGVTDAPVGPRERVSLGLPVINHSAEVWIFASGVSVAGLVAASFAGAPNLPSARVAGQNRTWWWLDQAAAGLLPYHRCRL